MVITGEIGRLRVGYQDAAELRRWSLTRGIDELNNIESVVVAKAANIDDYWITQTPLKLELWMGGSWWVWRKVRLLVPLGKGSAIELIVEGNPMSVV